MPDEQRPDLVVAEWVRRAADDEHHARADLRHRDASAAGVCFLAQQMAEKYLKALLVAKTGRYERTHDLNKLVTCIAQHVPEITDAVREQVPLLDPHYTGVRYPADIPIESYTWTEAEASFDAALAIKVFVEERLRGGMENHAA